MAVEEQIQSPQIDDNQQVPPQGDPVEKYYNYLKSAGADVAPNLDSFKKTLSNDSTAQQYYGYLKANKFDAPPTYGSFAKTLGIQQATQTPAPPEHEIQHTSLHDIRHLVDLTKSAQPDPLTNAGPGGFVVDINAKEKKQAASDAQVELDRRVDGLSKTWGTGNAETKKAILDFPDEEDENKLKGFATLAKENPVSYSRLKNSNDIRVKMSQDGQAGIHDANVFNHLQDAQDYSQLTDENIPYQLQLMRQHNMGQPDIEKLKEAKRPLINALDPGLLAKYWNGPDKELGLTSDEFAGLETERLFNPGKAQMDLKILKHAQGIGEDGKATPLDLSKESYEYQRGVENVRYNLQQTGRENKARYVSEFKPDIDKQVEALKGDYQTRINEAPNQVEQQRLIQEFANHPLVQEANKLEDAAGDIQYSQTDDQRRYPLNFADQATRAAKEAMDNTTGFMGNAAKFGRNVLQGAGESADNTLRWIKNTAINLVANEQYKSFNAAKNIGHQALTELSSYEPTSYTGRESPLIVPRGTIEAVQGIFKDSAKNDQQKEQEAITYLRDNWDQLKVNPKFGQQNLTGKAAIFQAANVMGQILGVANQSFLLGGAIGDVSKLQQMATAFTPMFMSTQNQMYEQALKNGDENPLLKSNIDAAIISLASLINPDIKVVKGMVGAETGLGKMIAGIDEKTWNKVLSTNKPWVDRTIAAAKATGRQLGLANLQYGVIAPTAQYLAHKSILNEDANLEDMIKDGVIQTNITMALPALLHGVWGGIRASQVNPNQKYAIVEAGLHPDQNIDLIDSKIKAGTIPEIQGHEMKQLVKHAGEILQNTEMIKTDGTPMNENEVADVTYNMLRKAVLEKKMKTAAEPVKPIIEEKIHEINKDIADMHTSDTDKQKAELNQLLHDNLDRIKEKMPTMEGPVKDAIARNEPEEVYKEIASQALETTKVEGKEVSSRPLAEEIFGKALVEKAIELSKNKSKPKVFESVLTKDAEELLASIESGSKPAFITNNLKKIAQKNGITVTDKMTPDDVINELKNRKAEKQNQPNEGAVADQATTEPASSIQEPSNIPNDALQESSTGGILQHPQEGVGSEGGGRGRVEPSQQGEGTPEESGGPQAQQPPGEVPPKEVNPDALPFGDLPVGISHEAQIDRSKAELNVAPPERGEGVTLEEAVQRGRDLIAKGIDPDQVLSDFKKTGKISMDDMSVVRAKYEQLAKVTNEAYDKYGENSPEAKAAFEAERGWYNTAVKPMQTEWSRTGVAQQGATDVDTGSVMAIKRAVKEKFDKDLTPLQLEKAKQIAEKNKELNKQVDQLQKKLDAAHSADQLKKTITFSEKTKKAADVFRKLKTKEFSFKDKDGNDVSIQKMGISWNELVELGAKAIEKTGEIADGISAIIDSVKETDWYKKLSTEDKDRFEKELGDHYTSVVDKKTASRIKALEKQLADLEIGNIKEKGSARKITEKEQELKDKIFEAKNNLGLVKSKAMPKQPKTPIEQQPIAEKFVNKKDESFTPVEAKEIWEYTKKNYLDKETPFPDALKNTATDLGLNRRQVLSAIATPKGAREITMEMYKKQYERTKAINSAKVFIETANNSKSKNFFNLLPTIFFNLKTYGHGTVGFLTHAGPNIFRPSVWKAYWPNFFRQFSFAYGNTGKYEMALEGLKNSEHYNEWKRAGLAVDPSESYDQYQLFGIKQSWLGEAGTRGFNALKFLRYDMAESFYKSASNAEKADPALRDHIAELVNHATGHSEVKVPSKLAKVFFAPGLEISRWQRMITDPAKAVNTLRTWNSSTPAEKAAAKIVFRGAGEKLATYGALLAANAGMLAASGSKQKINTTDPSKSDWLKFKGGGKTLDFTGGVLNPLRLLSVVTREAYLSAYGDKKDLRIKPGDKDASTISSQVRYKFSPIAATGADMLTGTDAMGNPLPWSNVTPSKGKHKIDWFEFAWQQAPIPIAAGAKEIFDGMRERGMSTPQINDVFNGALQFGLEGFTGVKMMPDYSLEHGGDGGGAGAGGDFGRRPK